MFECCKPCQPNLCVEKSFVTVASCASSSLFVLITPLRRRHLLLLLPRIVQLLTSVDSTAKPRMTLKATHYNVRGQVALESRPILPTQFFFTSTFSDRTTRKVRQGWCG